MVMSVTFVLKIIFKGFSKFTSYLSPVYVSIYSRTYGGKMSAINLTLQQGLTGKLETKPLLS